MAKKRRKRNRRPVAPPIHSAPDTVHGPTGPGAVEPPPVRPFTPDPPVTPGQPVTRKETPRRTPSGARRMTSRRRKTRRRNYIVAFTVLAVIIAAVLVQVVISRRSVNEFNSLAEAAGCGGIRKTGGSGAAEHLAEGEKTSYDTTPPTHGKHATTTLSAGVYDRRLSDNPEEQLNIYKAVHSLEHGAVIIWYEGLQAAEKRKLESTYRNEEKVLVVPYPLLKGKTEVAMTAWGRIVECQKLSTDVIDAFIDRFREARSAPEPRNSI